MSVTALDIIKTAMRLNKSLATGEVPTAAEGADALVTLNELLESWGNEGLLLPFITSGALGSLVSGQSSYTIGSGGDFNVTRPLVFRSMFIRDGSTDYPVAMMSDVTWAGVLEKTISNRPTRFWYNPTDTLGTIQFDVPADSTDTVYATRLVPFTTFASLSTAEAVPDEYLRAIRYNLAVDLAPEYEMEVPVTVARIAEETKRRIKARNAARRVSRAVSDFYQPRGYDIDTGWVA